jgi:hypothetical protein
MPIEPPTTHRPRHRQAEERRLRVGILRLGSLLGWDAPTVGHFAEGVTGRPLSSCGCAELRRVLEAYATLARRVRDAQARQPGAPCPHGRTR